MPSPVDPYRADILGAAAKYKVPPDLLASQLRGESGFNPNARSPAGAEGIAQFMPATAKGFGINPLDPHQAIDAQGKYMSRLYKQFGSWDLALAAYNAGSGAVSKAGGIPAFPETQKYVSSVQAGRKDFPGLAAWKAQAKAVIAQHGPPAAAAPVSAATSAISGAQQAATQRTSLLQSIIDQNSQIAGIATTSVPMPVMPYIAPSARPAQAVHNPAMTPRGARAKRVGAYDLPTTGTKVIGTPYSGTHTLGNWESDNAIDISTPVGSPIYATQSGVIGSQFGSLGASSGSRFAGLRLHLKTANDEFYYAHLSRFAPGIKPGARVQAGQIIGYSGSANGVAHLHIGARSGNPLQLFKLGSR